MVEKSGQAEAEKELIIPLAQGWELLLPENVQKAYAARPASVRLKRSALEFLSMKLVPATVETCRGQKTERP